MINSNVVTLGLVQMAMSDDREANFAKAEAAIKDMAHKGAQIVSVSELFLSPYFCQTKDDTFFSLAEEVPGPGTQVFSRIAKETGVVIIGSLYEKAEGRRFNTAVVFDVDGAFLGKYRKLHIPDDPEHGYSETYYFEKGDMGVQVFDTKFAKIAPMICWDQWFPEIARIAASKGAQILFYPTAIGWSEHVDPKPIQGAEHEAWQTIQRSHSIANGVFVAAVNRVGVEDELNFWGTSFVSDPFGRFVARASADKEENLLAACDLSLIDTMRRDWPFLDSRRYRVRE